MIGRQPHSFKPLKITIVAVGNRMPDWVQSGWDEYAKRMPPDWPVTLKEVKPEPRTIGKTPEQMMAAEARRIESAIPDQSIRIALDEKGKDLDTKKFADTLNQWHQSSTSLCLIIGGPDGLHAGLKQQCQGLFRLSSMTMPHPLVRVVLIEQIYRAWSLINHHPYHRD